MASVGQRVKVASINHRLVGHAMKMTRGNMKNGDKTWKMAKITKPVNRWRVFV